MAKKEKFEEMDDLRRCIIPGCGGVLKFYDGMVGYEAFVCPMCNTHYKEHDITPGEKGLELIAAYSNHYQEIQELINQINDAIASGDAYLWQDNLEDTVSCVITQDSYTVGDNNNGDEEDREHQIKVTNFLPLWKKLYELLSEV